MPAGGAIRRDTEKVADMDARLKEALDQVTTGGLLAEDAGLLMDPATALMGGITSLSGWGKAAMILNGYSPDDMIKRLAALSDNQLAAIQAAALFTLGPDSRLAEITASKLQTADAHFFDSADFGGRFDGIVDPTDKTVTLVFRVKFDFLDGIRFGATQAGAPGWEEETKAGKRRFKSEFKSVVESTWSNKGAVAPKCPIGGVDQLRTKVVVVNVDSGEHTTFMVTNLGPVRSAVGGDRGQLDVNDNSPHAITSQVSDPTGKIPVQTTTTQATSTHEFGHAIGLPHVHCPGGDDPCYGVSEEERRDVMGAGNVVQVVSRNGAVVHDDFVPFERIATRWGQDQTGAPGKCNVWTAAPKP